MQVKKALEKMGEDVEWAGLKVAYVADDRKEERTRVLALKLIEAKASKTRGEPATGTKKAKTKSRTATEEETKEAEPEEEAVDEPVEEAADESAEEKEESEEAADGAEDAEQKEEGKVVADKEKAGDEPSATQA